MKITRYQLKSLILEEINFQNSLLLEMPEHPIVGQEQTGDYTKDPNEYGTDVVRRSLFHMTQQAQQLHDLIQDGDSLESVIEEKIKKAAAFLEEVFKSVTYDKGPGEGKQ